MTEPRSGADGPVRRRRLATRAYKDPTRTPELGPYATAEWADGAWKVSLTAEGLALVAAYLAESPVLWPIFRAAHPTTFAAARAAGLAPDDINSECVLAAYRAAETYDSAVARFGGYVTVWMRAEVGRATARWARNGSGCLTGDDGGREFDRMAAVSEDVRYPAAPVDAPVLRRETVDRLHRALAAANIKAREREIVAHRFGLGGAEPLTLRATAERFGVTTERVRQIQGRALRLLRARMADPDDK